MSALGLDGAARPSPRHFAGMDPNPYAPPRAELAHHLAPSVGWRLYLWLLVLILVPSYGYVLVTYGAEWIRGADIVDMAVTAVALIGLAGYAYSLRVGVAGFWKLWLPLELAWDVLYATVLEWIGIAGSIPGSESPDPISIAIGLGMLLPLWIGLYRYGYRSKALWDGA